MSILYCVLTTGKYKETRQKVLKKTWLKDVNYVFLSDIDSGDNFKLTDRTDYQGAAEKQLNAINLLSRSPYNWHDHYDWYFFCDDDTFVNTKLLNEFSFTCFEDNSYGKVLNRITDPYNPIWLQQPMLVEYFSGGAGFLLSKKTIKKLHDNFDKFKLYFNGDVTLGFALQEIKATLINSNSFNMDKPKHYHHQDDFIKSQFTYHYIDENEMTRLYGLINDNHNTI